MIRYPFDQTWVEAEISKIDEEWLGKAKSRTQKFIQEKSYNEKSGIWSVVKPVYMALQKNKCIFCERQFESAEYGTIEHDLEHFRPKGTVDAWPTQKHPFRYDFSTGEAFKQGYYWLAYHLQNYAASCKVCNSIFKSDFFPIAGNRAMDGANPQDWPTPAELQSEKPYLCYPLGEIDADPEQLITFQATIAIPFHTTGFEYQRAKLMIDFFRLNEREQLHLERARMISLFGASLARNFAGNPDATDLQIIALITQAHLPHSSCLKAFAKLWQSKPQLADEIYQQCRLRAVQIP